MAGSRCRMPELCAVTRTTVRPRLQRFRRERAANPPKFIIVRDASHPIPVFHQRRACVGGWSVCITSFIKDEVAPR